MASDKATEVTTIYLAGKLTAEGDQLLLPLSSCAVMLMAAYTDHSAFHLAFVTDHADHGHGSESESYSDNICISLPYSGLSTCAGLSHEFLPHRSVPGLVVNVLLPAVLDVSKRLVRSGLCVVVRHLVKVAHAVSPQHSFIQLLGFRQGSLRMCAEVSGWTKLCEVELPHSVACLVQQLNGLKTAAREKTTPQPPHHQEKTTTHQVELPADLIKLEAHFEKPPKIHNDDKQRRAELSRLQKDVDDDEKRDDIAHNCRMAGSRFELERMTELPHGCSKFRVQKHLSGGGGEGGAGKGSGKGGGSADKGGGKGSGKDGGDGGDNEGMCGSGAVTATTTTTTPGSSSSETTSGDGVLSVDELCAAVRRLSYLDIQFVHLYSEGVEMTIADLCLFSYLYFLLKSVDFDTTLLSEHLPRVLNWLRHMITLPRLRQASARCSFNLPRLSHALFHCRTTTGGGEGNSSSSHIEGVEKNSVAEGEQNGGIRRKEGVKDCCCAEGGDGNSRTERESVVEGGVGNSLVHFCLPRMEDVSEDDMELSRRCRSKYKALKPEVLQALTCMKTRGIEPVVGSHPRGHNVSLDWDHLPACVNPREGDVPAKRVQRKCQQLENLVTAVLEVASPGDVIVDFCSGGGHLGLAIAHLLPQCMVYLVENKEESLLRAEGRMAALPSDNVILFQCNMDYFVGRFDTGVSLHACGSATDMVLQQCLRNRAAFVVCPCCYGGIQQTHLLSYPRSRLYREKEVTYKEFLTLGHAADQTEFNIALEQQGRQCMNLVDSDRAELAREAGYTVTLTSLQPLTCSPKNNLLIGHRPCSTAVAS